MPKPREFMSTWIGKIQDLAYFKDFVARYHSTACISRSYGTETPVAVFCLRCTLEDVIERGSDSDAYDTNVVVRVNTFFSKPLVEADVRKEYL